MFFHQLQVGGGLGLPVRDVDLGLLELQAFSLHLGMGILGMLVGLNGVRQVLWGGAELQEGMGRRGNEQREGERKERKGKVFRPAGRPSPGQALPF
jgi:hypothetical protein